MFCLEIYSGWLYTQSNPSASTSKHLGDLPASPHPADIKKIFRSPFLLDTSSPSGDLLSFVCEIVPANLLAVVRHATMVEQKGTAVTLGKRWLSSELP